eukprot:gene7294-8482_t
MLENTRLLMWNSAINTGSAIYSFGGFTGEESRYFNTYERFDFQTRTWTMEDVPFGGDYLTTCYDGHRYAYISGMQFKLYRFDTHTNSVELVGYLQYQLRYNHHFIHDGHLYSVGGVLDERVNNRIYMTNLDDDNHNHNNNITKVLKKRTFMDQIFDIPKKSSILSSCFDGLEFIYLISDSNRFIRVSIKSKEIRQLQSHPECEINHYLTMIYSALDTRIYYVNGGQSHIYNITTDQWHKFDTPFTSTDLAVVFV